MVKLLHIGLPKCGSTFLQKEVFPKLSKELKIPFINLFNNEFVKINPKKKVKNFILENNRNIYKRLPAKFIISNESLFSFSWEFSKMYDSFDILKRNFQKDTVILIVIRNPYDILNSIYCQSIQEMKIIKPELFFYNNKKINNKLKIKKYNLYNFDYVKLISLYKSFFKKVIVVKYEDLNSLKFLKNLFKLNNNFIKNIKFNVLNKSISKYGINLILYLNKFFDVQKYDKILVKKRKTNSRFIDKIINIILSQFRLRTLIQKRFDKLIYKKYQIDEAYIPLEIKKQKIIYEKLKFKIN